MQLACWTASQGNSRVHARDGILTLERGVLAQGANVKITNGRFRKVGIFDIGSIKRCARQDGIDKPSSNQGRTLEAGPIDDCIGKVGTIKVAFCSSSLSSSSSCLMNSTHTTHKRANAQNHFGRTWLDTTGKRRKPKSIARYDMSERHEERAIEAEKCS